MGDRVNIVNLIDFCGWILTKIEDDLSDDYVWVDANIGFYVKRFEGSCKIYKPILKIKGVTKT